MQKQQQQKQAASYSSTSLNKVVQAVVAAKVAALQSNAHFSYYVRFNTKAQTYYAYCITVQHKTATVKRAKRNTLVKKL